MERKHLILHKKSSSSLRAVINNQTQKAHVAKLGKYLTLNDPWLNCHPIVSNEFAPQEITTRLSLLFMKPRLNCICKLALLSAVVFFTSCASTPLPNSPAAYLADYRTHLSPTGEVGDLTAPAVPSPEEKGYWDGDGVYGAALIRINLADQKAYFYKGDQLVGQTPISTGTEGRDTPPGRFKVTQKSKDHRSSLYGVIKDDATGAIINDDAKTGRDIPKAGQTFVRAPMANFLRFNGAVGMHTGHLPGYAASHGCVRLPDKMAQHFYENASIGTPVVVE